ncbi:1-phosphofructokinase [Mesoplasma photuris]|uniref:1-phosphofructokinase n=1 Tax=Mesoplasma photuris TaxID=217731 RepID=UPI0004E27656|nr:1-phosphofructokinase [Mesoplasma photuris]
MIYSITLNPALDHIIETDGFNIGETNYYSQDYTVIGGKGINVSIVLNSLKANVLSTGIMGEKNKNPFIQKFDEVNLKNKFFFFDGNTRTNFKIKNLNKNEETEINGIGIIKELKLLNDLKDFLSSNLEKDDIVIASGSLPNGVPTNIYKEIGDICNSKEATFILDTSKIQMIEGIKSKPFLIKPNIEEICEILNIPFKEYNFSEIEKMIMELKTMGAKNVLLSMGSKGSYFFSENGDKYKVGIAKGKLVNSVGSGDSMIAGFAYGLYKKLDIIKTLKYGAAAGGATAFTQWLAQKEDIEPLIETISVEKI